MSNTHFAKYRGLVSSMNKKLTPTYLEKMIVREPQLNTDKLHPKAKARWNTMTQEPKPLTWKLHELQM